MLSTTSRNIVKISAAGSGKTYDICKEALSIAKVGSRVLITTYTNRGVASIKKEIRQQNNGVLHPFVVIKTWFSFMLSDMIKPYQRFLTKKIGAIDSFDYSQAYGFINYEKRGTPKKYIVGGKYVRSNEGASLVCLLNELSNGKVVHRLEQVYHSIFFDEVQDLAGDDITIIKLLLESSINIICCGDNKQATFCTHNAKKNKNKTGKNIWEFFKELEKSGLVLVEKKLVSRRFNNAICGFANSIFPIGDEITTMMNEKTEHDGVFLIGSSDCQVYARSYAPQVLRHDIKTPSIGFFAINFGACKGETFDRVMVLPNVSFVNFITKKTPLNSPEKYYVAVTRPKYSLAIVLPTLPKVLIDYKEVSISCGDKTIRALQYKDNT